MQQSIDESNLLAYRSRYVLTKAQARGFSKLSNSYLNQLLNNKTVEGVKIERDWFIYKDSLEIFLAKERKSGPRGPHKKQEASSSL